jgi:hypothetical protein
MLEWCLFLALNSINIAPVRRTAEEIEIQCALINPGLACEIW